MTNITYESTKEFLENNPDFSLLKEYSQSVAGGSNWVLVVKYKDNPESLLLKHAKSGQGEKEKALLRALSDAGLSPKLHDAQIKNGSSNDFILLEYYAHKKDRKEFLYKENHNLFLSTKIKEMHEAFKNVDESNYQTIYEWLDYYIMFATKNNTDLEAAGYVENFKEDLIHQTPELMLIHGDFHFNNILFSLDTKDEVKFVDPDGVYSRPEQDLACFAASAKKPVEVFSELYKGYYGADPGKEAYAWARMMFYIMRDFFSRTNGYEHQFKLINEEIIKLNELID